MPIRYLVGARMDDSPSYFHVLAFLTVHIVWIASQWKSDITVLDVAEHLTQSTFAVGILACFAVSFILMIMDILFKLFFKTSGPNMERIEWTDVNFTLLLTDLSDASLFRRLMIYFECFCREIVNIYISSAIDGLSMRVALPSRGDHLKMFFAELIVSAIFFHSAMVNLRRLIQSSCDTTVILFVCSLMDFLRFLTLIVRHVLCVRDLKTFGGSGNTQKVIRVLNLGSSMARHIVDLIVLLILYLRNPAEIWLHVLLFVVELSALLVNVDKCVACFTIPEKIRTAFPKATTQDLENSDICILCRGEMSADGTSLVLPCKHCCHHECLGNWLQNHDICPVCSAHIDLKTKGFSQFNQAGR